MDWMTSIQKVFTILCDCTVSEYIRNRRMTLAGYEIIDTDISILDIALKYGYESHESFTRAFTRFHGLHHQMLEKIIPI